MYNLILDFDKLPIFSIRPCMKISYINRPFIKLKSMSSVATATLNMPGYQAEHISNRKQSLPEPWRHARVKAI